MRWTHEDFEQGSLNLTIPFQSTLPGQSILKDSVLDPGLELMPGSAITKAMSIYGFAVDTLRLQQYMAGWSSQTLGVLSEYAPYFESALGVFEIPMTTNAGMLIEDIILTGIGATGEVLSAIPNPYTKIVGAIIGMGTALYSILETDPTALPPFTIPAQEYNQTTDEEQFNSKVVPILQAGEEFQDGESPTNLRLAFDYTPFFMPRMRGEPVLEYRYQGGRLGVAFGLGEHGGVMRVVERDCEVYREKGKNKARCDDDIEPGRTFTPGGPYDLGYVPGGVRITSVIQSFPTENPDANAPWYDPRCGSSPGKANGTDVGEFYTSTNQGIQLMWDMAMKNSPQMFCIDTARLKSAWSDYMDAVLDGVVWLWNNNVKDDWGQGTWHAMLAHVSSAFTVGVGRGQTSPGAIGTVMPDLSNCGALTRANDPAFFNQWETDNLYAALIKPALESLEKRQAHYLSESLIAAYLPRPVDDYVCGAINSQRPDLLHSFYRSRAAILDGYGKIAVNIEDVVDLNYREQIEAARPMGWQFDVTIAPEGPPGPGIPSGRLVAPPVGPKGDPPFLPPPPGGPRRGMSTPLKAGLAVAGVGAGAAFLGRHQIAEFFRRRRDAR